MLTSLAATALIVGATTYNIAFIITIHVHNIFSYFWFVGNSLLVFSVVVNKLCDTQSIKVPLTWISEQYLHD